MFKFKGLQATFHHDPRRGFVVMPPQGPQEGAWVVSYVSFLFDFGGGLAVDFVSSDPASVLPPPTRSGLSF